LTICAGLVLQDYTQLSAGMPVGAVIQPKSGVSGFRTTLSSHLVRHRIMPKFNHPLAALIMLVAADLSAHEFNGSHGTVTVDWQATNISRVIGSGYGDSFGTEAWARKGLPEPVEVEGRQCVRGSYFLFDVDDEFAFDIDETVTLEFDFDRTRSQGMFISYDQNVVAENIRQIEFSDSDEVWHTQSVTLERARFANRGESGTDFTLTAPDGTWFGDPNADHKIVLCDVRISRSFETPAATQHGLLRLTVNDELARTTPARVGIYDHTGRMPLPSSAAVTINNYEDRAKQIFLRNSHGMVPQWPHENRWFFYIDGEYEAELPVGQYLMIVSKGPEYRQTIQTISVGAEGATDIEISVPRWVNMPALGWYSGDDHVHMARTPNDNASISAVMAAEDVHVTNVLQMGNPYDTHFHQYAFGKNGRYRAGNHALVPGVEDPRTAVRGHTISLNIKEVFRPSDRYLRYDQIFAEYREQGGMSGFAHVAGRLFNVERGLAIDVPLGAVDFVEILQDGGIETELWYDFLNLGFKLIPTAGSDFPYLGAPGSDRNYVYVGDNFTVDAYYEALGNHDTFVSSGPMIDFTVNELPMGSDLRAEPGEQLSIHAFAALNPDIEAFDRLELVVHGEVVAVAENTGDTNSVTLAHTITAEAGMWLAVRAYGAKQTIAHSAPIYVTTGAGFENPAAVPAIARRLIDRLQEFETTEADETQELEAWSVGENLGVMLTEQRIAILERAEEARTVYARMLDRYQD